MSSGERLRGIWRADRARRGVVETEVILPVEAMVRKAGRIVWSGCRTRVEYRV